MDEKTALKTILYLVMAHSASRTVSNNIIQNYDQILVEGKIDTRWDSIDKKSYEMIDIDNTVLMYKKSLKNYEKLFRPTQTVSDTV